VARVEKGKTTSAPAAPGRRGKRQAPPPAGLSYEERKARLDRAVAVATREFAARVGERTDFEVLLVRGEPVRHRVHLVRLAVLAVLVPAVAWAFDVSGSTLLAVLLVPAAYAVYWSYLVLTAGEQTERIDVDEDGRLSSVRTGHDADLRADVLKVAIPSVLIAAAAWITAGLLHDIAFAPLPSCDIPGAVRDNEFCSYIPGLGGGTALTVGQTMALERAIRIFQLVYSAAILLGSIWFLRRMLTGRWVVDVRPVRRPGGGCRREWWHLMSRLTLWLAGAIVAAVAIVVSTFGLVPMLLAFLLAAPLVRRPDGGVALSGVLTGFGGLWLGLIAAESASGGVLDDAEFWVAAGVVPLVVGLGLLAGLAVRGRAQA
jgi:hypothetical protein